MRDQRGKGLPADWRQSNPDYQEEPNRTSRDGRIVQLDGSRLADALRALHEHYQRAGLTTKE